VGGVVVDHLVFRFSICGSLPEIFAIKFESCEKSWKNLDGFWLSQILWGGPSKNSTQVITPGSRHVVRIKICDGIPIRSEFIDVYTLNFKPNFKFSRLKFLGETPVPFGVCARWPWSISSACKNFRAQPPLKAKIQSAKKCALRWVNTQVNNFFVCGPKFKNFFSPTWEGL